MTLIIWSEFNIKNLKITTSYHNLNNELFYGLSLWHAHWFPAQNSGSNLQKKILCLQANCLIWYDHHFQRLFWQLFDSVFIAITSMQASFELSQIRIEQQTQFSSNDLLVIHCLGVGRGSTLGKNCFVIPDKKVCFRCTLKFF